MRAIARVTVGLVLTGGVLLATAQTPPMQADIPQFKPPTADFEYEKREVMIPMRDGVKLFTSIVIPKGVKNAPMILTRTPYNAAKRTERIVSPHILSTLSQGDEVFAPEGYIRVIQDVRGKYGSEGEYVMTRPLRGPLNHTDVDHSTDAYDTIDWLVKNVPETNGRVGMIGSSYEGFTVLMALINPHPALRAAVPMSPMVDGWKGDDWFHNGAFRQTNFDYMYGQTTRHAATATRSRAGSTTTTSCSSRAARPETSRAASASTSCPSTASSTSTRPMTSSGAPRRSIRSWRRSR